MAADQQPGLPGWDPVGLRPLSRDWGEQMPPRALRERSCARTATVAMKWARRDLAALAPNGKPDGWIVTND